MFGPLGSAELRKLYRLPAISRARGCRLYGVDGSRWLDCWLDGGRALCGHRPAGVSLRLKNEIDRGLYAPYPNLWHGRLEKALMRLFPHYATVRIFRDAERAIDALRLLEAPADPLDLKINEAEMAQRLLPSDKEITKITNKAIWGRPGLPDHLVATMLFPIMAVPGMEIQPVLLQDSPEWLVESDRISPLFLSALTRICGVLGQQNLSGHCINADIWEINGPYLVFHGSDEEYESMFEKLFRQRIIIAPSRKRPSIIPVELSRKELALLNGEL